LATGSPLAYVDGDRTLVTAVDQGDHQDLIFWDLASNTEQRRVAAPATSQASIAIHPSGSAIAVSEPDAAVSILKLDAATSPDNAWEPVAASGRVLGFHPRHRWVLLGDDEGTLRAYDIDVRSEVATFRTRDGPVKAAMFDSTGRRCATVGAEGVRVWDMSLGYVRLLLRSPSVAAVAFSTDGGRLAIADETSQLRLFDTSFPALQVNAQHWLQPSSPAGTEALRLIPKWKIDDPKTATTRDGRLVVRYRIGKLELAEADSDKVLHEFGGVRSVSVIAISPDDRLVATGALDRESLAGDVRLWNLRSGREIRRFPGHVKHCRSIDFSANGRQLLTGGTGYLHLWDVATGTQLRQIPAGMPFAERAAFSRDGRWVIAANNQGTQATAFDKETGELLVTLHRGYADLLLDDLGLLRDRQYGDLEFAAHGDD
jgi:WD40 repeat protein